MKTKILIILSLFLAVASQAQLRYKKIYPTAMAASKQEAFDIFSEFQKQDPNHMNTYYQLGLISLEWMFSYDPLTSYTDVSKHSYNAKLYFGLAKHKMSERAVKRDREFFQGIKPMVGEKLKFPDVKNYIDSVFAMVELYEQKTAVINQYFNRSIDLYNNCVDRYKQINDRNARLKDMVLTIDPNMLAQARELKQDYDSMLIYFQKYSNEVSTYDLVKYNQKLEIHPISTYRLEGLSQKNFLLPTIHIYNYGKWVDELFEQLDNDIDELRKAVKNADERFDENVLLLNQSHIIATKETPIFRLEDKLRYQIGKFDNSSLATSWFEFRDAQTNFYAKTKAPLLNPNDTSRYNFLRRAKFFEEVVYAKKNADASLTAFKQNISIPKAKKYPALFQDKYKGTNGLKLQVETEQRKNTERLHAALVQLNSFRLREIGQVSKPNATFTFKKVAVAHIDSLSLEELPNNTYKTLQAKFAPKGGVYLAGVHKINNRISKPFVAFSQDGENIDWLRKLNVSGIKYADNILLHLLPNGCTAMVHGGISPTKTNINVVVRLDEFGNEHKKTIMQTGSQPFSFIYDDINETILSVYKGNSKTTSETDSAQVYFNKVDGSAIWSVHLPIVGSVAGIIKMENNYVVFANFKKFSDRGQEHTSLGYGYNVCACVIKNSGTISHWEKYTSSGSYRIRDILKLNNNAINLLCEDISQSTSAQGNMFKYYLLDSKAKLKFSN